MGWRRIFPASQSGCGATPATWIDAAPILQACDSRASAAWAAGLRSYSRATSIQKPMHNAAVTINAAVAQERPVAADIFKMLQIALADQDFFLVVRGFYDDPPEGIAKKRSAPKFQAFALGTIAANVAELVSHAVDHADKNAVGDGVCALDGAPGIVLQR